MFPYNYNDFFSLNSACEADGRIIVQNPEIALFKSATAGTATLICDVSTTDNFVSFIITGCPKVRVQVIYLFSISSSRIYKAFSEGDLAGDLGNSEA